MADISYYEKEYMDNNALLLKTSTGDGTKFYRNVKSTKCTFGSMVSVGDDSVLYECNVDDHVSINRNVNLAYSCIGTGTYINPFTTIRNADIGKYCSISWNVSIGGKDHDYNNIAQYPPYWWEKTFGLDDLTDNRTFKNCMIGNDVWIGNGAIILREVSIGDGAVIAAGAVVTKDVPPYCIVAGIPAKVINKRFSDDNIERLLRIKWWDWPDDLLRRYASIFNQHLSDESIDLLEKINKTIRRTD